MQKRWKKLRHQAALLFTKGRLFLIEKKKAFPMSMAVLGAVFILLLVARCSAITPPKIGVVDMPRVYQQAAIYHDIKEKQAALQEKWRVEALEEKKALEEKDLKLSRSKKRMKKAVFDKQAAELRAKILDFQNRQMARLNLIVVAQREMMAQVEAHSAQIAERVAKKKGLDLIWTQSETLYANKKIDITDDFVVELDENMKDFPLKDFDEFMLEKE